jgi:hypothetical protein
MIWFRRASPWTLRAAWGLLGIVRVYASAQRIVHAQISFGDTYNQGIRLTQVFLDRTDDGSGVDDFYWVGSLTSNFTQ